VSTRIPGLGYQVYQVLDMDNYEVLSLASQSALLKLTERLGIINAEVCRVRK
jgi:hypothetical protein